MAVNDVATVATAIGNMDLCKTAPAPQEYDLLIVTDATSSMGSFLVSLKSSLNDIIRISATTASFSRIGVLGYRDYDRTMSQVTEWSGWHSRNAQSEVSQAELLAFVDRLKPQAGSDWPEAARTGLALAHQLMRPEAKTIVLLYADAPPHTERRAGLWKTEQNKLCEPGAYGGNGKLFADWTSLCRTLGEGEKRAQVFSIVEQAGGRHTDEVVAMFLYLSACTEGVCLGLPRRSAAATISEVTINLLLAWMGADKQGATLDSRNIASHFHYRDESKVNQLTSEKDEASVRYLSISSRKTDRDALEANIARPNVSLEAMSQIIPSREHPVMDFAKRYKADPEYQKIVVEQLTEIIESDVSALSVNPVFGTLWRTVCNDRLNPARDGLITSFGLQVDKTTDTNKKERLKKWLEESYDFAGEIVEMIEAVPEESRYPCVFLDPTVRFAPAENEEDGAADVMELTRDELLEIGRSCDYRILRRLGRILVRLTYVNSKGDLPAHVKDVPETEVPKIPMALAHSEHQGKFWKVLLHTVLPGTMVAARPAALLAALSVRLGIKPLEEVAYTELLTWRDNWNTLDIPETWSVNCLGLILEADKKLRQATAETQSAEAGRQTVLKEEDRKLFGGLVDYKMLEMNLSTTLKAEVGWSPNKSKAPLGPVVVCNVCEFPRSVTVMGAEGTCGVCLGARKLGNQEPREVQEARVTGGVSKSDNSNTTVTWSECSMTDCRAQYVVYNPKLLKVRPKCHYCRQINTTSETDPNYKALTTAPCVTCTKCRNRVIWPVAHRPSSFDEVTYQCPACTAGTIATIVTVETTASALASENGTAWLLRNDDATIPEPFNNRSLYHTITHISDPANRTTLFPSKVSILPTPTSPLTLTHHHKPLHNTPALLTTLSSWISRRRTQSGTCTLCFSTLPKRALHPACGGRRGCAERICTACAAAWYGANRPGRVLNTAALACPFCRRRPAPTAAALLRAVRCLGGVREAVEEQGGWVYAWCVGRCGSARRYVERVCARGAPPEVEGWRCEGCVAAAAVGGVLVGGGGEKGGLVVKMCPACGVATERTAGCDHISCPCGKHWCFNCAAMVADTAGEVYAHMSEVHHTWYEGGGGADYAEYEFESDEEEDDDDDDDDV
ncbi:hypothetical protein CHGG_09404 [Chaetomium globosum CBS 148.51]|uniref:RING-type domain-containing protein n=1 Tax=Chaetomium globosum (strain ATCC 6205 / CBS 148.51 / DSM 1962 / NBRC 6347 / NRRL 1970) TaxID=306901 RepID=Q2GRK0_CHAGB|nr:uncharacterized protein CHGG_09404 [Chaetomium globosum CBS 148.51]EAQ85390.1 hypothetical protein CHGG_09404 [Chaetomium globosum CBS 148.51]